MSQFSREQKWRSKTQMPPQKAFVEASNAANFTSKWVKGGSTEAIMCDDNLWT